MGYSLDNLLNPEVSKVTRSTDNLIITIYGARGQGKTPVAAKMDKPFYFAFGKSGLSGINNVRFEPVQSWADFKSLVKLFSTKKNYEQLHEIYHTLILDELEILYKYCEQYVANTEGVRKIKEGNGGYGLWGDLKDEWENEIMKIIGSGFCVMFILHAGTDDNGKIMPVGDQKRMLPILLNHSDIIGYVKGNGSDPETGRPIHSSLMLADTNEYFARTRNEYFQPMIEDYTADNLIKAYYDALDRQEKAEGTTTITKEEQDNVYEKKKIPFDELMDQVIEKVNQMVDAGRNEEIVDIVEKTLGKGGKVSQCTARQYEAVEVILADLIEALG